MSQRHEYLSLGFVKGDPTADADKGQPRATFDLGIQLSRAEYDEISAGLSALDRLRTPFHYTMVERNHHEIESRFRFVTILLSLERKFSQPDHRQLAQNLWTPMVNWLASMRTFLDHEETDLKRRFGKNSREVGAFKSATAIAFDGCVGYRFAYKFRNYVQHYQLPRMSIKQGRQPDDRPLSVPSARILLDRDALLERFDWGVVRSDIESFPESFDLIPLIDDAMDQLREVYRACLGIELDEAVRAAPTLVGSLERLASRGASDGQPALFNSRLGDGLSMYTFSPRPIPEDAVAKLRGVADGEVDKASLFSEPTPPSPPLLDPRSVRETFHRQSRGVQALAAYFNEGGTTDGFRKLITSILEEDAGGEPLLSGLVEVSVILAHMTSAAIGASAEGLVAGILDVYNEFED